VKIWSYVKGIVERNSLSGNWIASLDREVIKKSGYIGEAYVQNNKDRVIPREVVTVLKNGAESCASQSRLPSD
jgi:hypothetical protein